MINGCCCRKPPTRWEEFFEKISTRTVPLCTLGDGKTPNKNGNIFPAIPLYMRYNRMWWKVTKWIIGTPARILRFLFPRKKIEAPLDKVVSIPVPIQWNGISYNYDIRSILKTQPLKCDEKKRTT